MKFSNTFVNQLTGIKKRPDMNILFLILQPKEFNCKRCNRLFTTFAGLKYHSMSDHAILVSFSYATINIGAKLQHPFTVLRV
jgi:hypothetical protein